MSDHRTLDERYTSAMHSSNLTPPTTRRRVDVDYLIAAGVTKDGLGAKLYRLAGEWDLAAGDYRLVERHMRAVEMQVAEVRKQAKRNPEDSQALLAQADRLLERARSESLTAKALAMVHLKTLRAAKDELGGYAVWLATHRRFMEPDDAVLALAARALQLWLDPLCQSCEGRGFTGGFGVPKVLCTACSGTGRAFWAFSMSAAHSTFVRALLSEMDLKTHRVERAMARYLRNQSA